MKKVLIIVLFAFSYEATSQTELPTVIPSTPETAALLRYSEVPVSYYNGIPNITIPIYTIEGRSLAESIGLSYHAGGIRVNQESTLVGLGWNLAAGGQITRVVKDKPDDINNGFINAPFTVDEVYQACIAGESLCSEAWNASDRAKNDFEPDDFNYSMMGLSGRFMFNQNRTAQDPHGEIVQFPNKNVQITPTFNSTGKIIIAWTIIDTQGTTYEFIQGDKYMNSEVYSDTGNGFSFSTDTGGDFEYIESWNLASVTNINNDVITFEYEGFDPIANSYTAAMRKFSSTPTEKIVVMVQDPEFDKVNKSHNYSKRYVTNLSKIVTSKGYVKFINLNGVERLDLRDGVRLDRIEVYDNNDIIIQEIELVQDYFTSAPSTETPVFFGDDYIASNSDYLIKRLYLKEVIFKGSDGTSSNNIKYVLEYNTDVMLPHKRSYAQDH